jgi:zinc protease
MSEDLIPGTALLIGTALTTGLTLDDLKEWPERIDAVTANQVREAVRAVLVPERSVTGMTLPIE